MADCCPLIRRTSHTGTASTVHEPFGKPSGPGLFHHKGLQLPAYVQHVAHHLVAQGRSEGDAIGEAIGIIRNWAHGHDGHGHKVHSDVQAAAAKALAQWEADKATTKARRAAMAGAVPEPDGDYDADGLDGSWDGDLSDLPHMGGMGVSHMEAAEKDLQSMPGWQGYAPGQHQTLRAAVGSGARFRKLSAELAAKGAHDPHALAAWIGRRKYSKPAFQKLAAAGRKRHHASRAGGYREWEPRPFPLEDIRILTRAEGYGSGTVVEAYATVFDTPAEIHDHEGHYTEVIDRSAFDMTLARLQRTPGGISRAVKVLYNHGKTAEGAPAPEFQVPIGVPLDVRPEARGLLTRTDYDTSDQFCERILGKVKSGAISAYSFVGSIMRSDPGLRPGERYRARNGALTTVRRMQLGLREYGPVLWPAYSGAEVLGVRMQLPGSYEPDLPEPEEYDLAEVAAGGVPEDTTSARYHQHALYRLRSQEMRESKGLTW